MSHEDFHGKIIGATVTRVSYSSNNSIVIDKELLKASGILSSEEVEVLNVTNGTRFSLPVIDGSRGTVSLFGSKLDADVGDILVITADSKIEVLQRSILVGKYNRLVEHLNKNESNAIEAILARLAKEQTQDPALWMARYIDEKITYGKGKLLGSEELMERLRHIHMMKDLEQSPFSERYVNALKNLKKRELLSKTKPLQPLRWEREFNSIASAKAALQRERRVREASDLYDEGRQWELARRSHSDLYRFMKRYNAASAMQMEREEIRKSLRLEREALAYARNELKTEKMKAVLNTEELKLLVWMKQHDEYTHLFEDVSPEIAKLQKEKANLKWHAFMRSLEMSKDPTLEPTWL